MPKRALRCLGFLNGLCGCPDHVQHCMRLREHRDVTGAQTLQSVPTEDEPAAVTGCGSDRASTLLVCYGQNCSAPVDDSLWAGRQLSMRSMCVRAVLCRPANRPTGVSEGVEMPASQISPSLNSKRAPELARLRSDDSNPVLWARVRAPAVVTAFQCPDPVLTATSMAAPHAHAALARC